jgi:hypothetical protein
MWVVAGWWACVPEPSMTDSVATADTATPQTPPLPPPPPVDAADLARALQTAVDWVPELSLGPCYESWRAASTDRDDTCPPFTTTGDPYLWETEEVCTTVAGSRYFGILTTGVDQRAYVEDVLWPVIMEVGPGVSAGFVSSPWFTGSTSGLLLDGSVWLRTGAEVAPSGAAFTLGGNFRSVQAYTGPLKVRHHALEGFCHGGVPPAGTWVDAPIDPWLHLTQVSATGEALRHTLVDGSLSNLPAPYGTVDFAGVAWVDPALGGCAVEPDGTVTIRRDDGVAVTLAFDSGSCDGCAEAVPATAGATVLGGPVCFDAAPLGRPLRWEELAP